ncbi:phage tail assembly protein [Streptomyces sp. NPDC101393]|uniref:phage tail assembly protein n=1 Tax=Streptomyces sp. NPDC101393 TaxID=3366141 RepID=UPI003818600B
MGTTMTFNCADALAEVETNYRAMEMTTRAGKTVHLRNILLLPDTGLKTAMTILKSLDGKTEEGVTETLPKLRDLLLMVADDPAALKVEMKDWPLAMAMNVVQEWQKVTDLGEAQPSDS